MEKKLKQTIDLNSLNHKFKRYSWFSNSTWILLLLMSTLIWQCEKDTFEGETISVCPKVTSTAPANGATLVVTNTLITATFNETMVPASVNETTFTVKTGDVTVLGDITYTGMVATFMPLKPLEANKTYSGTITRKVKDPAGNYPLDDYHWNFTTGSVPMVLSTDPANATSSVPLNKIIKATFSRAMNPATVNPSTFIIKQDSTLIKGAVTYADQIATFTPESPLSDNTVYTGVIDIGATDTYGNAMASVYTWSFSTAQNKYNISLSSNPAEGGSTSGGGWFNMNDPITVLATPVTGYTFTNWTEGTNVVSSNSNYSSAVTGNKTFVANFTMIPVITYTLNVTTLNGVVVKSPNSATYDSGSTAQLTATPSTGYTFTSWSGDATGSANPLTVTMNSNMNITANFTAVTANTYTLNVTAVNGSVVKNPNTANYNSGSTVQLTATPSTGYTFTSWSGDATGSANPLTVTMSSNKNITANFTAITANTYTLNVTAVNGSTVKNPDLLNYNSGAMVDLSATPDNGYVFSGWSGDATGTNNPLTVTMNSNMDITAEFTLLPADTYTLDVIAVDGTVVKNPDLLNYNSGETVELTATANSGFTFTSWSGDASGSTNPLTVTMNSNKNITANFSALVQAWPDPINLGAASDFAILAGSGISNTGVATIINGDVGSFPTATINGLLPGNVNGTLYTTADPVVGQAKNALDNAYFEAQSRSLNAISLPGQIGGLTLAPGLYVNSSTSGISGTGPNGILTLDAGGNSNAVWIFKVGSTFITDAGTSIVLAGGAQAGNIYWSVGTSATLGTNSAFYGILLADQSITLTTGATLNGVAYTRVAAVTLDSNTVTKP